MPLGDHGFGWVNDRFGVSWQLDLRGAGPERVGSGHPSGMTAPDPW
jgi:predicted 3-demethylubiquinone-9 3-methyltransferase (glyoxalase superfamily)